MKMKNGIAKEASQILFLSRVALVLVGFFIRGVASILIANEFIVVAVGIALLITSAILLQHSKRRLDAITGGMSR